MKIEDIIENGENEKVEFKEGFGRETIESIVAMANSRGGFVIIGVNDKGKIVGVNIRRNTLSKWANEIIQSTDPKIIPDFEILEVEGRKIVVIKVDEFPVKPVFFRGRAFKRIGASNKRLNQKEIAEMFEASTGISWDYYIVEEAGIEDLDLRAVEEFAKLADLERYGEIEILKKLHLLRDGKITRAAILLFGKEPQKFFFNAVVRVGRFKRAEIMDSLDIKGNLFNQAEEALNAIKKHLSRRFVIREARREELWDYPINALREAVINALIHRDYRRPEEIEIKIYDDHLTIWNPGELPYDITLEDLYREHPSHPRNRLIAEVFYLAGYIEKWGSGTLRIIESFKERGLPIPKFKTVGEGLLVEFWKDIYTEEHLRALGLNDREIKAVLYVKEKGRITNKEYQKINNVSKQTATRELSELRNIGIFEIIGTTGRGTYYVLKDSQRTQRTHKRLIKDSNTNSEVKK